MAYLFLFRLCEINLITNIVTKVLCVVMEVRLEYLVVT